MSELHPATILAEQLKRLLSKPCKTSWQEALLPYYQADDKPDLSDYWLVGTQDCHLCDQMWELCQQAMMGAYLKIVQVELTAFDDTVAKAFAPYIPVLVRRADMVVYPFGLFDVLNNT